MTVDDARISLNGLCPVDAWGCSDIGRKRRRNEDRWHVVSSGAASLSVVADGMGGAYRGDLAASVATKEVISSVLDDLEEEPSLDDAPDVLVRALSRANKAVFNTSKTAGRRMGTTLSASLIIETGDTWVASLGDSRVYLWRDGELEQITCDHTLTQALRDAAGSANRPLMHSMSNILLRFAGQGENVQVDFYHHVLQPGDRLLLCTDGLWGELDDQEIQGILATQADPRDASEELLRHAYEAGGRDNITCVVCDFKPDLGITTL